MAKARKKNIYELTIDDYRDIEINEELIDKNMKFLVGLLKRTKDKELAECVGDTLLFIKEYAPKWLEKQKHLKNSKADKDAELQDLLRQYS